MPHTRSKSAKIMSDIIVCFLCFVSRKWNVQIIRGILHLHLQTNWKKCQLSLEEFIYIYNVRRTTFPISISCISTINLGFQFRYEVVYTADRDIIFLQNFQIFKSIFYERFYKNPEKTQTNYFTPKGWLNASTALGHMLIRRSVAQTILTFTHQLTSETVGICGIKCCLMLTVLFTWRYKP